MPLKERRPRWPREARMLQDVPHRVPKRPDTSSNPADIRGHTASARNHGACPPHAAAAEWIIGIQQQRRYQGLGLGDRQRDAIASPRSRVDF